MIWTLITLITLISNDRKSLESNNSRDILVRRVSGVVWGCDLHTKHPSWKLFKSNHKQISFYDTNLDSNFESGVFNEARAIREDLPRIWGGWLEACKLRDALLARSFTVPICRALPWRLCLLSCVFKTPYAEHLDLFEALSKKFEMVDESTVMDSVHWTQRGFYIKNAACVHRRPLL